MNEIHILRVLSPGRGLREMYLAAPVVVPGVAMMMNDACGNIGT